METLLIFIVAVLLACIGVLLSIFDSGMSMLSNFFGFPTRNFFAVFVFWTAAFVMFGWGIVRLLAHVHLSFS
jgi:hypothetical protein